MANREDSFDGDVYMVSSWRQSSSKYQRPCALVVLVAASFALAACGGPIPPNVADLGKSGVNDSEGSTTGASSGVSSSSLGEFTQGEQLQFARCMRSHGVANYPDPSANGGQLQNILKAGLDTQSPGYQAALQACKKYTPAGHMTPAQSAAENAKGLEFTQCMRLHGVSNYPDPSLGPDGQQVINLNPTHIDPNSSIVQRAQGVCQKAVPGFR
jgi:hypothetical protein